MKCVRYAGVCVCVCVYKQPVAGSWSYASLSSLHLWQAAIGPYHLTHYTCWDESDTWRKWIGVQRAEWGQETFPEVVFHEQTAPIKVTHVLTWIHAHRDKYKNWTWKGETGWLQLDLIYFTSSKRHCWSGVRSLSTGCFRTRLDYIPTLFFVQSHKISSVQVLFIAQPTLYPC